MLCICAFSHHHILSLHMGSKGLSTATQYVLKKRSYMSRNDTLYICHTLLYKKELLNSLYFLTVLYIGDNISDEG